MDESRLQSSGTIVSAAAQTTPIRLASSVEAAIPRLEDHCDYRMSTYDRACHRALLCSLAVASEAVAGVQRRRLVGAAKLGERFGHDPGRILAPCVISTESLSWAASAVSQRESALLALPAASSSRARW
jgi:hypothetical protein